MLAYVFTSVGVNMIHVIYNVMIENPHLVLPYNTFDMNWLL